MTLHRMKIGKHECQVPTKSRKTYMIKLNQAALWKCFNLLFSYHLKYVMLRYSVTENFVPCDAELSGSICRTILNNGSEMGIDTSSDFTKNSSVIEIEVDL